MAGETVLKLCAGPCVVRFQAFPGDLWSCWLGKLMSDWQRSGNSKKGQGKELVSNPNKQHFQALSHFGFECMTSWNCNGFTSVS